MKEWWIKILVLIVIVVASFYFYKTNHKKADIPAEKVVPTTSNEIGSPSIPQTGVTTVQKSIFVPYWTVDAELKNESGDQLFYFGIAAGENGINKNEPGYQRLEKFVELVGDNSNNYLTLRMLDTDTNFKILEDSKLQEKIISESVAVAQANGFKGLILDLELSVLPISTIAPQVNTFVAKFSTQAHQHSLKFAVTAYGDTFYRARPFDMKFIADHVDEIVIMAYDFSKSYGEAGPNFPLAGREKFGYDFSTMIKDFRAVVPPERLTVIFGRYGYDWKLGPQGKPLKAASVVTLNQAEARFISGCNYTGCKVGRDQLAKETNVRYKDDEGYNHEVWFEDEESIRLKTEFLKEQGIGRVGFWAYGY